MRWLPHQLCTQLHKMKMIEQEPSVGMLRVHEVLTDGKQWSPHSISVVFIPTTPHGRTYLVNIVIFEASSGWNILENEFKAVLWYNSTEQDATARSVNYHSTNRRVMLHTDRMISFRIIKSQVKFYRFSMVPITYKINTIDAWAHPRCRRPGSTG